MTAALRKFADGVVAAGLPFGGKLGKALDEAYENLRIAIKSAHPEQGDPDSGMLDGLIDIGLSPIVPTDYRRWKPTHWVLDAPDVVVERGGFDAVIGNPPFLGGKKVSGALGTNVREWLVNVLAEGTPGNADMVAYFFLRAQSLLKPSGAIGLIATSTIAQGDTREVGLDQMVASGLTITRAIKSSLWPAGSVNLLYSAVWGSVGSVADDVARVSDGVYVERITTLLEPGGRVSGRPLRLGQNADLAYQGCIVLGKGFLVPPEDAQSWIAEDPRSRGVLFPYLNGDDLSSRSDLSASRWVVDFNGMSEEQAAQYDQPYSWIKATVRPERQRGSAETAAAPWWLFWRSRPALRKAIADLDDVLVIALQGKSVMPLRVHAKQVFSHMLGVFATDSYADLATLSSAPHQLWAITYGSTLGATVRYTPSDVFETFPRPQPTGELATLGQELDVSRRDAMRGRGIGLTALYNLVNDPDTADASDSEVARIRIIHAELDTAVMDAYGWSDIPLNHGFHTYRQMQRWTVSPAARVEILDRLLEENHRRAAEEARQTPPTRSKGRRGKSEPDEQGTLL